MDGLPLRFALMTGSVVGILFVSIALARYPASSAQTALYLVAILLLALCSSIAWRWARLRTTDDAVSLRLGGLFGLLIGACWLIEVVVGNLGDVVSDPYHLIYRAATGGAFSLPLVAGIAGSRRTGRIRVGASVGFWSGLLSGLLTLLSLMFLTYAFMPTFQHDPQTVREFARSHERDLATFIVGDSLFAGCSHLVLIGVVWGTVVGTLGGALGVPLSRRLRAPLR